MKDCACMNQRKKVAMGKVAAATGKRSDDGKYACGGPAKKPMKPVATVKRTKK